MEEYAASIYEESTLMVLAVATMILEGATTTFSATTLSSIIAPSSLERGLILTK